MVGRWGRMEAMEDRAATGSERDTEKDEGRGLREEKEGKDSAKGLKLESSAGALLEELDVS
jgi:hypothetical protein